MSTLEQQFVPVSSRSGKIECVDCHRQGWPNNGLGWQKACLEGHPFKCSCGRVFATQARVSAHIRHHDKDWHWEVWS